MLKKYQPYYFGEFILRKYLRILKCVRSFMVKDDIVALSIMIQIYRHIKYPTTEQYRRAVRTAPGGSYHTAKWITQSRILSVLKDDHRTVSDPEATCIYSP